MSGGNVCGGTTRQGRSRVHLDGLSSGIGWETEAVFRICSKSRIVLMPPCRAHEDASRLEFLGAEYDHAARTRGQTGVHLPVPTVFLVHQFDGAGNPHGRGVG